MSKDLANLERVIDDLQKSLIGKDHLIEVLESHLVRLTQRCMELMVENEELKRGNPL